MIFPEPFNVASRLVDRNLDKGQGDNTGKIQRFKLREPTRHAAS